MRARPPTTGRSLARLSWLLLSLLALAVLVCARLLTPSATGVGTHVALGLPPCGFLAWFGLPCPACGLTTSFAHVARLELAAALHAHPLGLPLFVVAAALVPAGLRWSARGEAPLEVIDRLRADRWALVLVAALLGSWLARLFALSLR
jgi:hypothetical protein